MIIKVNYKMKSVVTCTMTVSFSMQIKISKYVTIAMKPLVKVPWRPCTKSYITFILFYSKNRIN